MAFWNRLNGVEPKGIFPITINGEFVMDLIIVCGEEEELISLASALNKKECKTKAEVNLYNHKLPEKDINKLFLVGHANIQELGRYSLEELLRNFKDQMNAAQSIYLAGCSTNDSKQQILKNQGFIASTLGKTVKKTYPKKAVWATPSSLYLKGEKLEIATDHSQGITNKDNIWVEVRLP